MFPTVNSRPFAFKCRRTIQPPTLALILFFCTIGIGFTRADCWYNGDGYGEGEEVTTAEPCLNCTCSRSTLLCYLRVCPKLPNPPPPGCILLYKFKTCCPELICQDSQNFEYNPLGRSEENGFEIESEHMAYFANACIANGTIYAPGSAMDSSSYCEYCYCLGGKQRCVKPKCLLPIEGCSPMYHSSSCCPVHYKCVNAEVTTSTTTQPPKILENSCLVSGTYHPNGHKILGVGHSPCDNCYCIKGLVRCEPLSCAPPLLGCSPVIKPGECCAASYNCSGTIEARPEVNYNNIPIMSKEYAKLRKEATTRRDTNHIFQYENVATTKPQRTSGYFGTTRHFSGNVIDTSTNKPKKDDDINQYKNEDLNQSKNEDLNQSKNENLNQSENLNKPKNEDLNQSKNKELNQSKNGDFNKPKNEDLNQSKNGNFNQSKKDDLNKPKNDHLNKPKKDFKENLPLQTTKIYPEIVYRPNNKYHKIETIPESVHINSILNGNLKVTSLETLNIKNNTNNTNKKEFLETTTENLDLLTTQLTENTEINDATVLASTIFDLFTQELFNSDENIKKDKNYESNENNESNEVTSSIITTDFPTSFFMETEFNSEPTTIKTVLNSTDCIESSDQQSDASSKHSSLHLELNDKENVTIVDLESKVKVSTVSMRPLEKLSVDALVLTKDKDDYEFGKPTLPPSLPNLKIIPFLASDAVDTKPEEKIIYPAFEDRTDTLFSYVPNSFNPPNKTESGFVPKDPPPIEDYYDSYTSGLDGNSVTAITKVPLPTQNEPNGVSCLHDLIEYRHGETIPSNNICEVCECFFGNVICHEYNCPPIKPGCRESGILERTTCCPHVICDDKLEDSSSSKEVVTEGIISKNPFKDVIRTEPAPNLDILRDDMTNFIRRKAQITTQFPQIKEDDFSLEKIFQSLLSDSDSIVTTSKPKISTTLSTINQLLKIQQKNEFKTEQNFDQKIGQNFDQKFDQKIGPNFDLKFDQKIGSKFEDKIGLKFEDKIESKFEDKIGFKIDQKIGSKFEDKIEDKNGEKIGEKIQNKIQDKIINNNANDIKPSESPGVGLLKLAGCNIYGRMYRVGRIISELSGPCLECKCTEIGVQCKDLC